MGAQVGVHRWTSYHSALVVLTSKPFWKGRVPGLLQASFVRESVEGAFSTKVNQMNSPRRVGAGLPRRPSLLQKTAQSRTVLEHRASVKVLPERCKRPVPNLIQNLSVKRENSWHGKHDIRCESVPDPRIEDSRDAIIRVTACAICGSDHISSTASFRTCMQATLWVMRQWEKSSK